MSIEKISQIKGRLRQIDAERKRLLGELSLLQTELISKEPSCPPIGQKIQEKTPKTPDEKISLFLKLFGGRTDVYPKLWKNNKNGKKGYSPVCNNEWVRGICDKPKVKCTDCPNKSFQPLNELAISNHLRGKSTIGTYTIRHGDTCTFLAADFDDENWQDDVLLFMKEGEKLGIDIPIERSRSGNGAHAWVFFSEPVPAFLARQLGSIIMTKAIMKSPQFKLSSYDRFFPNQDYMPKGGFGNLIALPLQKEPREAGNSVFLGENMEPLEDQWGRLASVRRLSYLDISNLVDSISNNIENSDFAIEDNIQSWSESALNLMTDGLKDDFLGKNISATIFDQLRIDIDGVPSKVIAAFKRFATFANPVFFQKQKMRLPTWKIPKYIFCGELEGSTLVLPRGTVEKCKELCEEAGIDFSIGDQRSNHKKFRVSFKGKLRKEQRRAVEEMEKSENGVLVAAPGSGKTVMACALISKRKLPTLVLVHRSPLLDQWKERIEEFLNFDPKKIGVIGAQKKKPQGKIDIAMLQTISRMDEKKLDDLLGQYSQIIVDECHHIAAFTFESILKKAPSKHIVGLTATPYRKDGHQAIIHMQCGPIRFEMTEKETEFESKRVVVRDSNFKMSEEAGLQPPIHQVWSHLIADDDRLDLVADDVVENIDEGRIPLVISERKEHLQLLRKKLIEKDVDEPSVFVLDGDLSKKQRKVMLEQIDVRLAEKKNICLLTTGSLIGEGFDLPALDTLFIAMPVAFRGKVIQYAGRIHRSFEGKEEVRIYDYVDQWSGLTVSMFKKRIKAYRSMGYQIESPPTINIYGDRRQSSLFR